MIFCGWKRWAICRAKRRIADMGTFGDGYLYGCTYGPETERFLPMTAFYPGSTICPSRKRKRRIRRGPGDLVLYDVLGKQQRLRSVWLGHARQKTLQQVVEQARVLDGRRVAHAGQHHQLGVRQPLLHLP